MHNWLLELIYSVYSAKGCSFFITDTTPDALMFLAGAPIICLSAAFRKFYSISLKQ